MNSNLPAKQNNSIFQRIKKIFNNIFFKREIKDKYEEKNQIQHKIECQENRKKQFEESIRDKVNTDYINEIKIEEFLDKLESNPKLLYDLPIEKLKKLENYYEESIKKHEERLLKMKNAS